MKTQTRVLVAVAGSLCLLLFRIGRRLAEHRLLPVETIPAVRSRRSTRSGFTECERCSLSAWRRGFSFLH